MGAGDGDGPESTSSIRSSSLRRPPSPYFSQTCLSTISSSSRRPANSPTPSSTSSLDSRSSKVERMQEKSKRSFVQVQPSLVPSSRASCCLVSPSSYCTSPNSQKAELYTDRHRFVRFSEPTRSSPSPQEPTSSSSTSFLLPPPTRVIGGEKNFPAISIGLCLESLLRLSSMPSTRSPGRLGRVRKEDWRSTRE